MPKKLGLFTAAAFAALSSVAFAGQSPDAAPPGYTTWPSLPVAAQPANAAAPVTHGQAAAVTIVAPGPYGAPFPTVG